MALSDALAQLDYPCRYPFKLVCRANSVAVESVPSIIAEHAPEWDPATIEMRASRNGNYVAVTAVIQAESAQQIEDIYMALKDLEGILTSL